MMHGQTQIKYVMILGEIFTASLTTTFMLVPEHFLHKHC
jgi:hypothetical protein